MLVKSNRLSETFLQVYDHHVDEIWRFIKARVANPEDAEDLTSEVFLRAFRGWDRYDPDKASVRTWLFVIARNVVIDWLRKREVHTLSIEELPVVSPDETPEQESIRREILDCLARNLKILNNREAEALSLRFGSELTSKEIGKVLGLNEGGAKMLIHRTIKKLRELCL